MNACQVEPIDNIHVTTRSRLALMSRLSVPVASSLLAVPINQLGSSVADGGL